MSTDLDYQLCVVSHWQPLLEAAGLWSSAYDALNCVCLAKIVMDDVEVNRLSSLPAFQIIDDPEEAPAGVMIDWKKLFAEMGPAGRAELRDRIKNRTGKR